jgi:hypothetical protein
MSPEDPGLLISSERQEGDLSGRRLTEQPRLANSAFLQEAQHPHEMARLQAALHPRDPYLRELALRAPNDQIGIAELLALWACATAQLDAEPERFRIELSRLKRATIIGIACLAHGRNPTEVKKVDIGNFANNCIGWMAPAFLPEDESMLPEKRAVLLKGLVSDAQLWLAQCTEIVVTNYSPEEILRRHWPNYEAPPVDGWRAVRSNPELGVGPVLRVLLAPVTLVTGLRKRSATPQGQAADAPREVERLP